MNIRALVFNSGTYQRSALSKMSEQDLWNLYQKDEKDGMAQVQCYELDELSCAFNDEEVSDQDWLYFVDLDNINPESDNQPEKVWVFTAEQAWDGETADTIVKAFKSEKEATDYLLEFLHNGEDSDDESILQYAERMGWETEVNEPLHYLSCLDGYYPTDHIECTITECELKQ